MVVVRTLARLDRRQFLTADESSRRMSRIAEAGGTVIDRDPSRSVGPRTSSPCRIDPGESQQIGSANRIRRQVDRASPGKIAGPNGSRMPGTSRIGSIVLASAR